MHSIFEVLESSDPSDETSLELISLETLKTALGITGSTEDAALTASIMRASSVISEVCDRKFGFALVEETFIFDQCESIRRDVALVLSLYPVFAIESVLFNGAELTDYDLSASSGMLWLDGALLWGGRIVVTYSGGYYLPDGAPGALQQACIQLVSQYRNASSAAAAAVGSGIREIDHGDSRVVFDTASQSSSSSSGGGSSLPDIVLDLLGPFKRLALA